jgi:hypothetical protein
MKRNITTGIIGLVTACLLAGCSGVGEVTMRISEQELRERLSEKFPVTKDYNFVGTVTYANPRIKLRREDNRVELGLDIILGDPERRDSMRGVADMIVSVVYNAEKKALYLAKPQLQQFVINGMPEQNIQLLSALFMPAIEKMLKRKPVYQLTSQDAAKKVAAKLVKDIRVRDGCLEIVYGV